MASLHKCSLEQLTQGQYGVVKWYQKHASFVNCLIRDAVESELWTVSS